MTWIHSSRARMSCVLSIIVYLARKDTKIFAFMQINGEKVAIFWCKVYGVKCKGGNYSILRQWASIKTTININFFLKQEYAIFDGYKNN